MIESIKIRKWFFQGRIKSFRSTRDFRIEQMRHGWKGVILTIGSSLDSCTHSSCMIAQVGGTKPSLSTTWSSFMTCVKSRIEENKTLQSKGSIEHGYEGWGIKSTWQPTGLQDKSTHISIASGVWRCYISTDVCARSPTSLCSGGVVWW